MANLLGWGVVAAALASLAVLLWAEKRASVAGMAWGKVVGSGLFVAAALHFGALHSVYGQWMLAGLALSWVGDVFLAWKQDTTKFRTALFAFLLGHVTYVVAFLLRGPSWGYVAVAAVLVTVPVALLVVRWLQPAVAPTMWYPVLAYIVVISAMMTLAVGVAEGVVGRWILVGALMFYVSDLTVARDRFIAPGFLNRVIGLPLYLGGQWALAWSVSF